jgi:biopolymer transport protein ExbD
MPYRSDPNLIPGMGFTLMVLLIVIAFQWTPARIALPIAANADPRPAQPNEIVLRIYASRLMELSVDDEWGATVGWSYRQPHTPAELERELRRLYAERTEDRVLHLRADTTVPFGVIEQAMIIAGRAGVRVVAAVTEQRISDGPAPRFPRQRGDRVGEREWVGSPMGTAAASAYRSRPQR